MIWICRFLLVLPLIVLTDLFPGMVGYILYLCGCNRTGVKLVGYSCAGFMPYTKRIQRWVADHCPDCPGKCDKCRIWTCEAYKLKRADSPKNEL